LWTPAGDSLAEGDDALHRTADALRAGQIAAVKGLGGFHLMVDARNAEAIARLRERKPRRDKPFALMVRNLDQAKALCEIPPQAEELLSSAEAPIVLLRRRATAPVAENVAPGNPTLGVMLPYTPLHHLLLRELDFPVIATSGNLTDEPICTDEHEAIQRLGHIADLFLVHDRPIARHAAPGARLCPLTGSCAASGPDHSGRGRASQKHGSSQRGPPGLHQPAHR
jgi:hydrogenase maturation protein HypF